MANLNLAKAVNAATRKVLASEKYQAQIEKMQLDLANDGKDLIGKSVQAVWRAHTNALKRQDEANKRKVDLMGDYTLVANLFKKVSFAKMPLNEIDAHIYNGHQKLRDEANEQQLEIIKQHAQLESKVIAGRLTAIANFLKSKGIEVELNEDVQRAGDAALNFAAGLERVGKVNPAGIEVLSIEEHEKKAAEQARKEAADKRLQTA